VEAESETQE